jgi:hypothetical protein
MCWPALRGNRVSMADTNYMQEEAACWSVVVGLLWLNSSFFGRGSIGMTISQQRRMLQTE